MVRARHAMLPVLGALLAAACQPDGPAGAPDGVASTHPEQSLIEELVLANRMLASEHVGVLDAFGHVSARSRTDPDRYYIARYVSAGIVTMSDIIENDLDGNPVDGPRSDQFQEIYIHGEIYKARPDVMAVVHAHTPELAAFSVSSVALADGDDTVPVWDVRRFNAGRPGIVNTPALGRAMVQTLGDEDAVLLLGHGVVVTGNSVYGVVSGANSLRDAARLQQRLIAMGGDWDPNPRRVTAPAPPDPSPAPAQNETPVPSGSGGGRAGTRAWEYWRQLVLVETGGVVPVEPPAAPARPESDEDAIKHDLVLASRMLASLELGILDAFGHVSVRNPANPERYFIPRYVSAGIVTIDDIIENDLDSRAVDGPRDDQFQEIYMHGEIYKARPDVMAIVHAHTPELRAFTHSSVVLRPVVNGAAFIGAGLPMFDVRRFDPRRIIINTPELGRAVAAQLGGRPAVLLTGHGVTVTDSSLYGLVSRAYGLRMNALIQQQAIALGGEVTYLEAPLAPSSARPRPPVMPSGTGGGTGAERAWEYWQRVLPID